MVTKANPIGIKFCLEVGGTPLKAIVADEVGKVRFSDGRRWVKKKGSKVVVRKRIFEVSLVT